MRLQAFVTIAFTATALCGLGHEPPGSLDG
jgi:hypothetical protein